MSVAVTSSSTSTHALAGCELEFEREPVAVAENVDFVENPPRQRPKAWSSGSSVSFFSAARPHRAALTVVPSMHHSCWSIAPAEANGLAGDAGSRPASRPLFHASNMRQHVFHVPNSAGTSRHGCYPVRSTHNTPSSTCRGSCRGRPVAAGSGEKRVRYQFPFIVRQQQSSHRHALLGWKRISPTEKHG